MLFANLMREFNTLVDAATGNVAEENRQRYDELKAQHVYVYEHENYLVGVRLSYQVKQRVVEPLFLVSALVCIEDTLVPVNVSTMETNRIGEKLFYDWKKGDKEYEAVFDQPNVYDRYKDK